MSMNAATGYFERELLETFYLIVEEYLAGKIGENAFHAKLFRLAERYGRQTEKGELNRNQMSLFSS